MKKAIRERADMEHVLSRRIEKERKHVKVALNSKGRRKWIKKDFTTAELDESPIDKNALVSETVFNFLVSRFDVRKIKNPKGFVLREGKTTVREVLNFFFPKKERKKSKKKKNNRQSWDGRFLFLKVHLLLLFIRTYSQQWTGFYTLRNIYHSKDISRLSF